jgi:hypothetical protein
MLIIGVDYHPSFQQIVCRYRDWGVRRTAIEPQRWRSREQGSQAEGNQPARGPGGHWVSRWFERLLAELGIELWIPNHPALRETLLCLGGKRVCGLPLL